MRLSAFGIPEVQSNSCEINYPTNRVPGKVI